MVQFKEGMVVWSGFRSDHGTPYFLVYRMIDGNGEPGCLAPPDCHEFMKHIGIAIVQNTYFTGDEYGASFCYHERGEAKLDPEIQVLYDEFMTPDNETALSRLALFTELV